MLAIFRRLRARLKYRHFDRDLAQELETHRAMAQEDLEAKGLSAGEARPAAARALGNVTYMREEARAVWMARWLEQLWQDVRYALRGFRRQPGFALTSVLTLGVALGLLTSVFAVFSALYLRPWQIPNPDQVFLVAGTTEQSRETDSFSQASFEQLSTTLTSADLVARRDASLSLPNGPDTPRTAVHADYVSDRFIATLLIPLQMGSGFANTTGAPSVVISYQLWQNRFDGRADILGQSIVLSEQPVTVVGVLGENFAGLAPRRTDVLAPMGNIWHPEWTTEPDACCVEIYGRVKDGFTLENATAELVAVGPTVLSSDLVKIVASEARSTTLADRPNHLRQQVPMLFSLLFAATLLVLALACANVGNLHLARGVRRQRELAIRLSLGAGRPRVIRQLLTESLALTGAAALVGLGVSLVLPEFVLSFDGLGSQYALSPDSRTYGFIAVAAIVMCALFAVAPSFRFSRDARLTSSGTPASVGRLRSVVLGVQVATSITLVTAATLLTRGVVLAATSDHGFALHDVVVAAIIKPPRTYDADRSAALFAHVQRELAAQSAATFGLTQHPPLYGRIGTTTLSDSTRVRSISMTTASFEVLGLPILSGRAFTDDPAAHEIVVNQAFASEHWPGKPALGKTLDDNVVVGVTSNARITDITISQPLMFLPLDTPTTFFVTFRKGEGAEQIIRQVVDDFDPRLALRVAPVSDEVLDDLDNAVAGASVASGLGVLALVLSVIGVFGVAAFLVEDRRREVGIRLALGARPLDIRCALVGAARGPLAGGLAAGLGLALLAAHLLRAFLLDVSPLDPLTYVVVAALMLTAAGVATWLPMRRALRVSPAVILRQE